jgi:hypothetical protein
MKRLLTFEIILGLNIRQCYDTIVLSVFTVKGVGFGLCFWCSRQIRHELLVVQTDGRPTEL